MFYKLYLIVFPDQHISPDEYAKFMKNFGNLNIYPQELSARTTLPLPLNSNVELMLNKPGAIGPGAVIWPTDVTFREKQWR